MIQRKQSLFLFIAALLNACLLVVPLYRWYEVVVNVDVMHELRVNDHYPSLIIAMVIILLPLVALFMFRNRKRQLALSAVSIVSTIGFITLMLSRVTQLGNMTPPPVRGTYWIGAILPIISILFLILAIMGIRKDDKLVKSMDRLR